MQERIPPALLTEAEARRYLGDVSRSTMYKLRAEGRLPVVHLGRSCRYSLRALDAVIVALSDGPNG